MNRTTYTFLFEKILAFTFLILQFQAFSATNTYYTNNTGIATLLFHDASNWSSTSNGLGASPTAAELKGTTLANFVAQNNATVSFTNDDVIIGTLEITQSCHVLLNNSTLEVKGVLTMHEFTSIDYGTQTSTLIIGDNLTGLWLSEIIHAPDPNITQTLVLRGSTNSLYYLNTDLASIDGKSIVRYEGGDQNVISLSNYQILIIGGTGTKTLSAGMNPSTTTDVKQKLELKAKVRLGKYDLTYRGTESNLTYGTGWIWTDGTGVFKNTGAASSHVFPVGDDLKMEALQLSNISNNTIIYGLRYGATNTTNTTVPNNGMGVWYINASAAASQQLTVSILDPSSTTKTVSAASKIAAYNTTSSAWETKTTTYASNTKTYQTGYDIDAGNNSFALFDCANLTLSPTTTPIAYQGIEYTTPLPYLKVNNGVPSYSVISTSAPTGFTAFISDASNGTLYISGTASTINTYKITLQVSDATKCSANFNYNIDVREAVTVYNGSTWSNGEPQATIDATFTGNYTSASGAQISARNIKVNAGVTVTLGNNSTLTSQNSITNKGSIISNCTASVTYDKVNGNYSGAEPMVPVPILGSLTYGIRNQSFTQSVATSIIPSGSAATPTYTMSSVVPGLTFNSATGVLSGMPTTTSTYTFTIEYTYSNCTTSKSYSLAIIDPISPNLYITPINTKTFGDADFVISTYSKNTVTPITYTVSPSGSCATLSGNTLRITCAGPTPSNTITITATQNALGIYKAESTTTTFFINKAQAKLTMKNTGFLTNTTGTLATEQNSDGAPTFTQLSGDTLATVTSTGQVTIYGSTGTFSVAAKLNATNNYTAFDSIYTFTINTTKKAPVAVNDTIVIEMGQDTTLNLLLNDYGITDTINATLTDIDIENTGIQKKYYSTSLGTFTIDPAGVISINPFEGFIGTDQIGYTVTDNGGMTSAIAYLVITVKEPFKIPELKANDIMTPNNDGLNDALVIANTNIESNNNLVITDQAGNIIYEENNYRNDWKGTNSKGNSISPGVYFYVFKEKSSGRILQNYVQISSQ